VNKLKQTFAAAFVALPLALSAGASSAATVLAPATGGSFSFGWTDGFGPIDAIDGTPEVEWSIALAAASILSVKVEDCCAPGDAFGLLVDGLGAAWDVSGFVGTFFNASADLFLAAGNHTISLTLVALAPNFIDGEATATFSAAVPVVAAVPLPASLPLLLAGLGGIAALRRKRKT